MTKQDIINSIERKMNYFTRRIKECKECARTNYEDEKTYNFYLDWADDYHSQRSAIASLYAEVTEQEYKDVLEKLYVQDKIGGEF